MKNYNTFINENLNPKLLRSMFDDLQKIIEIKYWTYGVNDNEIMFTNYNKMNNWSHKQCLILNSNGVFLETYKISKNSLSEKDRNDLEKYLDRTFAHDEVSYLIPIQEKELVKAALTKIDRFKIIGDFDILYSKPYMKSILAHSIGKRFDL